MKIIFMGTPNFAVPILKAINKSDHEILEVYKMGEPPPPIRKFKNTIKSPSGEPDVGSGNFTVKKP